MRLWRSFLWHTFGVWAHRRRFQPIYHRFNLPYFRSAAYDRLPPSSYWEPELTSAVHSHLAALKRDQLLLLDVGANIGFFTLNVLDVFPDAKIVAFEPSPYQRRILESILGHNGLKSVEVIPAAVSNTTGSASFNVHRGVDASGLDGFAATNPDYPSNVIPVNVTTLDHWWSSCNRPDVDFMKVDTEGAELLVLQGATRMIEKCRPTMALELWPTHFKSFSYGTDEVLAWLHDRRYELLSLSGRRIASGEDSAFGQEVNFMACPQ